jgi:ubiquinone/menaquinone biosynthesis C-methylase UbiE
MEVAQQMSDPATEERFHFNNVASLYDSVRPEYPELLIDDLIHLSEIPQEGLVLDVGCGTGKSTEPFARRGYNIFALDPGVNMLDICRAKLDKYKNVRYENSLFETWNAHGQTVDLLISGTAFHWVAESGYPQLMKVLKPRGAIGIFWHTYLNGHDPIYTKFDELYKKYAPELFVSDFYAAQEVFDRRREEKMLALVGFGQWRVIRYYENHSYSAEKYIKLMKTWSTHRFLNETLFDAVRSAIDDIGGSIKKPIRTTLCYAKREASK